MSRRLLALGWALAACGPSPQGKDEAAITYRARFSAESGVSTQVHFPAPTDGSQAELLSGLVVSGGGTATLASPDAGGGLVLSGRGEVEATFSAARVKGLGSEQVPQAELSSGVPDAGAGERVVRVNKGGSAQAQLEFEYTAERDCGAGCGGRRTWKFSGPVGLGPQQVSMTYEETHR